MIRMIAGWGLVAAGSIWAGYSAVAGLNTDREWVPLSLSIGAGVAVLITGLMSQLQIRAALMFLVSSAVLITGLTLMVVNDTFSGPLLIDLAIFLLAVLGLVGIVVTLTYLYLDLVDPAGSSGSGTETLAMATTVGLAVSGSSYSSTSFDGGGSTSLTSF